MPLKLFTEFNGEFFPKRVPLLYNRNPTTGDTLTVYVHKFITKRLLLSNYLRPILHLFCEISIKIIIIEIFYAKNLCF